MSKHHTMSTASKRSRRRTLWLIQGHRCAHCGVVLLSAEAGTLDHVFARSRRGGNGLRNLLLSCEPCNRERRNRPELSARALAYHRQVVAYCDAMGPGFGLSGARGIDDPSGAERYPA